MNAGFWLPLLRKLTEACPTWFALKNIDTALEGHGDVDSAVAAGEVESALEVFADHARIHGLPFGVVCRHLPGTALAFAVASPADLVELDLMTWITFRAGRVFRSEDLLQLAVLDARGFRRLRPGAEAGFLLLFNGLRPFGRNDGVQIARKRLAERLAADPEGVRLLASTTLPPRAGEVLIALADRVAGGAWDRALACRLELGAVSAAVAHPVRAFKRLKVRGRRGRVCSLTTAAQSGRRIGGDLDRWMRSASVGHEVMWTGPSSGDAALWPP